MLRRPIYLLGSLALFVAATCAAAPRISREVEGIGHVQAALALAQRIETQPALADKDRDRAAVLLRESAALEALAEDGRAALSAGTRHRLDAALERLQDALATAQAKTPGAAPQQVLANGSVTGTVTDAATSAPLANVNVTAVEFISGRVPSGAGIVASALTNASGVFTLSAVPPGKYSIRTNNAGIVPALAPGYVDQAYNGVACGDRSYCTTYAGTISTVVDSTLLSGIDFHLTRAGAIAGTLRRSSDNTAQGGIVVVAQSEDGGASGSGVSSSVVATLGNYQINGLPPGRYRVYSAPTVASGLQMTAYANRPCSNNDCYSVPVDYVTVTANTVTPAVDISQPALASLAGTIVDETSAPVAGATVTLISEDGWTYAPTDPVPTDPNGASTDAGGHYSVAQIRPGNYRLFVSAPGFLSKAYPNTRCFEPIGCGILAVGGVVSVPPATAVTGINMSLSHGATISGTITRASDASPVFGATVFAGNAAQGQIAFAYSDASGHYTLSGLPDGVLHVYTAGSGDVADTAYGNILCPGAQTNACDNVGPGVTAALGTPATGIDIAMAAGGTISGVISDATSGSQAPNNRTRVEIFAVPPPGGTQPTSYTFLTFQTAAGGYVASGLAPGAYHVIFASNSTVGWIDTAYGGAPCPRGGCDQSVLPTVFVTAGATTAGISATLPRGRTISGGLTDAGTGLALVPKAFDATGYGTGQLAFYTNLSNYAGYGQVDPAGHFLSRTGFSPGALFAGTFVLRSNTPLGGGYIDQIYPGIACPWLSCGGTTGTALTVAGTDLTGVNYSLSKGATLSGKVRRASDSAPLEFVLIEAFNAAGKKVGQVTTQPDGGYTLYGLPTGSYFVQTTNQLGYLDKLYNAVACDPFCNPVNGNAVAVTAPNATTGIDFSLDQSATIGGTVSDGGPAANVSVEVYGAIGNLLRTTTTAANGGYQFKDLAGGRYYVRTRNATGRADALYSAKPCVGSACQVRLGTPIVVAAGGTASGINLALAAPAIVTGTVTDQSSSSAMSGVSVQLLDDRGAVAFTTTTSATGAYRFYALATGNYHVVTRNTPNYIDESYNNVPCPAACDGLNGSLIAATAGSTVIANIALAQGASISGTLRSGPSTPVPGAVVQIYNSAGVPVGEIATNASGNYQVDTLPNGAFYLRSQNSLGFVDQVYDNHPCSGYCDLLSGNAVTIAGGASVGLIDFMLAPGGSISGTVSAAAGGAGIPIATVQAYDVNGLPAGTATTNASGVYTISGLKNATYKVRTLNTANYVNQVYNGQSCSPSPCALTSGAPVVVSGGAVAGINFSLAKGGTISGTATDLFNNPLPSGAATLYNNSGIEVATVAIVYGHWEFNGLSNGTYFVLIENNVGLIDQLYANVPCSAGACNIPALGTPIVLTGAGSLQHIQTTQSTAAIDLKLPTGQTISGQIHDATTSVPLAHATVYFFDSTGKLIGDGTTDALGSYLSTGGYTAGTYYAATANGSTRGVGGGYVNALYSGSNCLLGCNVTAGTPITIASAPVTGVNFSLGKGIGFAGTVINGSGNPLALVTIAVVDAAGKPAGSFTTNSLGNYSADGLPAGTYYARTTNNLGLQEKLYGGNNCTGSCNALAGKPIVISSGNQPQNINFDLSFDRIFGNRFE